MLLGEDEKRDVQKIIYQRGQQIAKNSCFLHFLATFAPRVNSQWYKWEGFNIKWKKIEKGVTIHLLLSSGRGMEAEFWRTSFQIIYHRSSPMFFPKSHDISSKVLENSLPVVRVVRAIFGHWNIFDLILHLSESQSKMVRLMRQARLVSVRKFQYTTTKKLTPGKLT